MPKEYSIRIDDLSDDLHWAEDHGRFQGTDFQQLRVQLAIAERLEEIEKTLSPLTYDLSSSSAKRP